MHDAELETMIADSAQNLIDTAMSVQQDRQSGETFQCCHMCLSWDEHQPKCPMPLLEEWLAGDRWSPKG